MTEPFWKQKGWNEVNPASEKPKFGRGAFPKEMNEGKGQTRRSLKIDDYHRSTRHSSRLQYEGTEHGLQDVILEMYYLNKTTSTKGRMKDCRLNWQSFLMRHFMTIIIIQVKLDSNYYYVLGWMFL